jgi:hypothetical protein
VGHGATHPAGSDAEELRASEGELEGDVGAGARVVRELVLLVHVEVDQLFLQRRDKPVTDREKDAFRDSHR